MFKKVLVSMAAIVAALCITIPTAAETFTSADGVLSIELPNEAWKQVEDPTKWIAFSDGGNVITVDHFSNGEKLPDMSVANEHYVNVYQAVFSTQNEVFIITGSVVDAAKIPEITATILSAKVLKYDTKLAVGKENAFTVIPLDKTMYVTSDSLNVRSSCSTDSKVIGGYAKGSPVKVTGSVQKDGKDLGWYQVNYENKTTGYVSGEFLSDNAPAASESSKSSSSDSDSSSKSIFTGSVTKVFDEDGNAYTLYETTDGYWRDNDGIVYVELSDSEFQVKEGMKRLSIYYNGPDDNDYSDQEGEGNLQYCYYCGEWYEAGEEFDNHDCPARDAAYNDDDDDDDIYDEDEDGYDDYYDNYDYDSDDGRENYTS